MCDIAFLQRTKLFRMMCTECIPLLFFFLNNRFYNLIRLRKIIAQPHMKKTLRHATPSIDLLFGKDVNVIRNLFV